MKPRTICLSLPLLAALLMPARRADTTAASAPDWLVPIRQVHARFTGQRGTFAQFGDSITVTQAFWTPLHHEARNASPAMRQALARVRAYQRPECWRDWKGPNYGSEGGQTVRWAHAHVDAWLRKLNPEVALIMFGSNDLHSLELDEYRTKLRAVVRRCLDNGTVVILSTIPPRHGFERKAESFAAAIREIARDMTLPLTDYHAEILRRRPRDWDGTLDRFSSYQDYDVPTLLSRDGVHPSHPKQYQNDYSEEALSRCGYGLRNYLTLLTYDEVVRALTARPVTRTATASGITSSPPSTQPWHPQAPPLPAPTGAILRATTVDELFAAAARVKPGETILLADGHYSLTRRLEIDKDRVTLRSASGRRERVVLDGGGTLGELLAVTHCSDVTIADLTVQNVRWNGIKINSETNVQRLTIYNCILRNIWQRAVKGVLIPLADRERIRPTGCRVQYCLFTNDRPKRYEDDPADTAENFRGNYIGGIDVMFARDWVISDNVFTGIHGRTGEARGAIFLWHDIQNCVVEGNSIIDCDAGICLGNSSKPADVAIHATGCTVRNNFLTRVPENGILADYTKECKILHNTIHDPQSRLGRLIRLVHENDGLLVANNLVSGPAIRTESYSRITLCGNLIKDMTAALADPAAGNLRLTPRAVEAIDRAEPLADVTTDIDRRPRGPKPDIGADELTPPK
jgi:hypothetical protein